jgi:hypothetical protein
VRHLLDQLQQRGTPQRPSPPEGPARAKGERTDK